MYRLYSDRMNVFFFLVLIGLYACGNDAPEYREIDLLEHGIPVTIKGPDSVDISSGTLGDAKDVQVRGGSDYHIQIFSSEANTTDVQATVEELKEMIREHPYFEDFVEEQADGFIYKTAVDSANINYSFRYILLRGDREIVFQPSMVGTYELEEIRRMYEAVKQE